ncbi:MAG: TetR/AcrR family transcriptional regulator [Pseudomonadota bacterium]
MKIQRPPFNKDAFSARERLILTAQYLFYQNGVRATGIDRIISEAQVTKVTFYRHFPSKHALICAYLDYRHEAWMTWFKASLTTNGDNLNALTPTLGEWFANEGFRGCAFINGLSELGGEFNDIRVITHRHKKDMTDTIKHLVPSNVASKQQFAETVTMLVDGAIIRAQHEEHYKDTLHALQHAITQLKHSAQDQ